MSQLSQEEELFPSVVATAGDSPASRTTPSPRKKPEGALLGRDSATDPALGSCATSTAVVSGDAERSKSVKSYKLQLVSRLVEELPLDSILAEPALQPLIAMHQQLKTQPMEEEPALYDWGILSKAFEYIYNAYLEEMQEINVGFEALDIKRSIWLESACRMDGCRAELRMQGVEKWISHSQVRLGQMKTDLDQSVDVIRSTLEKHRQ